MASFMRSEIVLVKLEGPAGTRPALVVQNDHDNQRMTNTIVAQITTNLSRAAQQTQLLLSPGHPDWDRCGLKKASVINFSNLATIRQEDAIKVIGTLSRETMQQVDECLKAVLELA